MQAQAQKPTQEIIFEHDGAQYRATVGEPISKDDVVRSAYCGTVEHSSARYVLFIDVRDGGFVAREVVHPARVHGATRPCGCATCQGRRIARNLR